MTSERAGRLLFALVALYLVVHAATAAYVLGALWDWRAFEGAWFDHAWELELVYQARLGHWSGRDFHYPRGPLWQAIAWLAGRPWAAFEGPRTLAGIDLAFHLLAIGTLVGIVLRRVRGAWRQLVILCALGSVSYAVGVPTFRALLSVLLVLLYVTPEDEEPSWGGAARCAGVLGLSLLVSFDRFGLGALSLLAMAVVELGLARARREALGPALRRAWMTAAAVIAMLAVLSLVGWALGADPVAFVVEQRRIASGYATGMRSEWHVGVPPINVLAFFVAAGALLLVGARARWSRGSLTWIAGALPFALFGVVTSDQGHVFMALLPLIVVLTLVAARAGTESWLRLGSGVLAATALLGWLGTYPESFSPHPRAFADALEVLSGDKRPDRGFRSDHGRAVAWARSLRGPERPACMSVSPSLGVVHAMAQIPGPTQLGLRWNESLQARLARSIREADCPIHLHSFISFDDIGGSWFLGADFLAVAERYRFDERVGVGVIAMRRRESPAPPAVALVDASGEGRSRRVTLPGELVYPFDRAMTPEQIVRVSYRLETPAWRAQLGGAPWVEWRFEHDGEALGEWETLHHLHAGDGEVLLALDPESVEHRWILERPLGREIEADALRLRFRRRGVLTDEQIGFALRELAILSPPPMTRPPEPAGCRAEVDLLQEMRAGRSFARMTSPRPSERHFNIEPNPHPVPLAEVFFRVRPCADSCFRARLGVAADPGVSDGARFEIHLIRGGDRARLYDAQVPAGGREVGVELPLDLWPDRPQLIRVGTRTGEGEANDYAFVAQPTIGPCSARTMLATALARDEAEVEEGEVRVDGRDLVLGPGVARVAHPLHVIDSTCLGLGASAEQATDARVSVWLRVDDLDQVLRRHRGTLTPTPIPLVDGLHDWVEREATLVLEVESERPVRLWGPNLYRCGE